MRRRDKTGGEAAKTQRPKTLKRRNAPSSVAPDEVTDVARLTRERDEALQQQIATSEVLSIIRRSPADAQPVFDAIVESAARLCGAIFSVVYLYDNDHMRIAATSNFSPEATSRIQGIQQLKRPERSHLAGRAILDRAVIHVHDVLEDPEYSRELALAGGWRAVLSVPLLRDGKPVGALSVGRAEPKPFSDRQVQLLQTFADQAVIAIENVRLFNEIKATLERQTATAEILKVISSSPTDTQRVFEVIVRSGLNLFGDAAISVALPKEGRVELAAIAEADPSRAGAWRSRFPGPLTREYMHGLAILDRRIVDVPDAQSAPPELAAGCQRFLETGYRAITIIPMVRGDDAIGALSVVRMMPGPLSEKQLELLKTFANQAVIAIENTRLLNELRQRTDDLTESLQQQTATADVLTVIASSTGELAPVFNAMLANAARLCEASYGALWLREGDAFRTAALHGPFPQAYIDRLRPGTLFRPGPEVLLSRVAASGQSLQVPDLRIDASYLSGDPLPVAAAEIAGIRTLLVVPMIKGGEFVGAIGINRKEIKPFTDKQIELVKNFADQAVIAIENTRLLNELRESLQQQTATADVLKVISRSTFNLQTVLDTLVESAARLCEADVAAITRPGGDKHRLVASYGYSPELKEYLARNLIPTGRGSISGRVVLEGRAVHVPDVQADPEYRVKEGAIIGGIRTMLGVPLLREGSPIGVMVVQRRAPLPFTNKQIELVTTFADQAVIAIENVRLFDEVQARTAELSESLEQQTATSEVLKVISSTPGELEPVFEAMLANAVRICGAKFGTLLLCEGDDFRVVAQHNTPPAFAELRRREPIVRAGPRTATRRSAKTKQAVQIADIATEQAYFEPDPYQRDVFELGGFRAVLSVPMLKDDQVIGAINIYRQDAGAFPDKQLELIQNFAAQAVIAIENARLLSELRQRTNDLSESLQQQTATADVLKAISRSAFDLKTVLDALVEAAARLCEADQGIIARERDGVYQRVATYGFSEDFKELIRSLPVIPERGTAVGRALLEGKVVHIPDVQADPEYTWVEAHKPGGFRTILSVPMLREGTTIGVLALTRHEVRPFTDKQIDLVSTFADQAAIAIENVRLFESVEARTRELAKSLEDLRTAQDRLVQTEKLASLGQLTAGIAHEIKNPLNFVNNFSAVSVELIDELRQALSGAHLDTKLRAEISEIADTLQGNLDKVVQHGKRADAIVKNMLLHSRAGSGEHRPVDINALVEESLNLAWHGARAEKQGFNITLERSLDPTAGEVDLFPQEITRALLNLISNGFYAATKRKAEANAGDYEPTLTAATKNLGDRVEIRIRDNGTGIPPEVRERLFSPFFTTKPAGEGTGLGLSISHDIIVKQHGGSIEVDTHPGEFTEFRIILPRAAVFQPSAP